MTQPLLWAVLLFAVWAAYRDEIWFTAVLVTAAIYIFVFGDVAKRKAP